MPSSPPSQVTNPCKENLSKENELENFAHFHQHCIERVENFLQDFLKKILSNSSASDPSPNPMNVLPPPLVPLSKALPYAVFNGGKRIRPLLVYTIGEALSAPLHRLHAPAAAVELIHCFSLVHDDLPAMDNDDFRRGKLTCHKVFGEANAILVGDALQSLSFELLSDPESNPNPVQQQSGNDPYFSRATGVHGMVGGQAMDMGNNSEKNSDKNLDHLSFLKNLHQKKTGELITASVLLAIAAADCKDLDVIQSLTQYSKLLGLAFQLQDDLLDLEGNLTTLGKTPGKDTEQEKLTFPKLLGVVGAKNYKNDLHIQMQQLLTSLSLPKASRARLLQIAHFFLERQY